MRPLAVKLLLGLIAAGYLLFVAAQYAKGFENARQGGTPLYTDFTPTYAASLLLEDQAAEWLYFPKAMKKAELDAAYAMYGAIDESQARRVGFAAWTYPPTFILLVKPLAALPYFWALVLWLAVTGIPYLWVMKAISPPHRGLLLAMAAPPTFFNVMYGQTGFLIGGLIASGLYLLRTRPIVAGVLIGLASVKPHLGLLLPFALAAGGHWRSFAAAAATVLGTIVLSIISLGTEPWFAFIGTLGFQFDGFAAGAYNYIPMATVFASFRTAGMSLQVAGWAQAAVTLAMVWTVIRVWRHDRFSDRADSLRYACVCFAAPLAVPMAYLYDLVLIVPGTVWLWQYLRSEGAKPWEMGVLWLSTGAILLSMPAGRHLGIQIAVVAVGALLVLTLNRIAMRESPSRRAGA